MTQSGTYYLFEILGCAALLLWGARMVRTGITRAYGGDIRNMLAVGMSNRFVISVLGLFAAAALQSSTAVALLATSFASIEVLTVPMGLALMLGADLGSALVTQLFALNIKEYWPFMIAFGFVTHAYFEHRSLRARQLGRISLGLGMVFLSLLVLGDAAAAIRESSLIKVLFQALADEAFLAILVAAILTWLAHSSLAVLLLIIALAHGGVVSSPQLAVLLVLGVNAGAALPAFFLTLQETPAARRIALGNLIFRSIGVLICWWLMEILLPYTSLLSEDVGQRILYLHIVFNLAILLTFMPFVGVVAALSKRIIPDESKADNSSTPRYLDNTALDVPSVALSLAARETFRMLDLVQEMLAQTMTAMRKDDERLCKLVQRLDDDLDDLYSAIKLYLTELTRQQLENEEGRRAMEILDFTTHLENIGDVIDKNLIDALLKKIKADKSFSAQGLAEIEDAYRYILDTVRLSGTVFMQPSIDDARELIARKEQFRALESESTSSHLERLREGEVRALETSAYHIDILRDLKRINSHLASVAYPILENAGQLRRTRLKK
jgi:phosphate:Na+ symporter